MQYVPFLRFLLPFITGICSQIYLEGYIIPLYSTCIGICFLIIHYSSRNIESKYRTKNNFGIFIFFSFLALGSGTVSFRQMQEKEIPPSYTSVIARIVQDAEIRDKSVRCLVELKGWMQKDKLIVNKQGYALLYLQKEENAESLVQGNYVIFKQNLQFIKNARIPDSFDYALHTRSKGIIYSQYVSTKDWERLGYDPHKNFREIALIFRKRAADIIQKTDLPEERKAFLQALLLGEIQNINSTQRASFSTAGISHILAVSGLHTGIIWWLLGMILLPFKYIAGGRLRYFLIITGLWFYAFFTGLSPSVTRATIMATMILAGMILGRKNITLNSLLIAAFLMLLYQPYYLFDIGFQLSFTAVLSITFLYHLLTRCIFPRHILLRRIWSLTALSLSAQIGTLPIAVYYFHEIPILFLLSNLLILPLLPFIMGTGLLYLFLSAIGFQAHWILLILNYLSNYVLQITEFLSGLPFASIKRIWLFPRYLFLYYITVLIAILAIVYRKKTLLLSLLPALLLFLIIDLVFPPHQPVKNGWLVFDQNSGTTFNFIDKGKNYIFRVDTLNDMDKIYRMGNNFWMKNDLGLPDTIPQKVPTGNLYINKPFLYFQGKYILILDSSRWRNTTARHRLKVDYAVICKGFSGKLTDLTNLFVFDSIIISADVNHFKKEALIKECRRLHLNCFPIKDKGTWKDYTDEN